MKDKDWYNVSGLVDAAFEPESDGLVLKNLLGITVSAIHQGHAGNDGPRGDIGDVAK